MNNEENRERETQIVSKFMIQDTRMNDIHLTIAIEWRTYQIIVAILVCGKHFNNIASINFVELDKDDVLSGILMYAWLYRYGKGMAKLIHYFGIFPFYSKMWWSDIYGVINGSNAFPNNTHWLNSLIATSRTILTNLRRDKDTPITIEASILFFHCYLLIL